MLLKLTWCHAPIWPILLLDKNFQISLKRLKYFVAVQLKIEIALVWGFTQNVIIEIFIKSFVKCCLLFDESFLPGWVTLLDIYSIWVLLLRRLPPPPCIIKNMTSAASPAKVNKSLPPPQQPHPHPPPEKEPLFKEW